MSDAQPARRNLPTLTEVLAPDIVDALIAAETEALIVRDNILADACTRFLQAYPRITDDEVDAKATEVLATVQRFVGDSGRVESSRVALKAPALAAGRQIDAAYAKIGDRLRIRPLKLRKPPLNLAEAIVERVLAHKAEVERTARAAAEAEAKRLSEVAALTERRAEQGSATYQEASAAANLADKAEQAAAAKPAARTRARGTDFGTTSLAKKRVFEVMSPALVPRHLCEPSDSLIRLAIGKAGDVFPIIPGVAIRDEDDLTVRR